MARLRQSFAAPARPGTRSTVAAVVLAPWLAFAGVRLLGLDNWHPLIAFTAFVPWIAFLSPIAVVTSLLLRAWRVALVASLTAVALLATIAGRTLGSNETPQAGEDPLVVMTANLRYGQADPESIVRLVRRYRVDVLSLQELTPEAVVALDAAGLRGALPSRILNPRHGADGSGLMSETPVKRLASDSTGNAQPEGEIHVEPFGTLRIKVVHPPPPINRHNVAIWKATIRRLPGPSDGSTLRILAGDFNATLDHSQLRDLLNRGFDDAAAATGDGLTPTFPRRGLRPGITIDHVLVPADALEVLSTSVHRLPGSDHSAVIAVIRFPSS